MNEVEVGSDVIVRGLPGAQTRRCRVLGRKPADRLLVVPTDGLDPRRRAIVPVSDVAPAAFSDAEISNILDEPWDPEKFFADAAERPGLEDQLAEMTVPEVAEIVADADADAIEAISIAEQAGKDRAGVHDAIATRRRELTEREEQDL